METSKDYFRIADAAFLFLRHAMGSGEQERLDAKETQKEQELPQARLVWMRRKASHWRHYLLWYMWMESVILFMSFLSLSLYTRPVFEKLVKKCP